MNGEVGKPWVDHGQAMRWPWASHGWAVGGPWASPKMSKVCPEFVCYLDRCWASREWVLGGRWVSSQIQDLSRVCLNIVHLLRLFPCPIFVQTMSKVKSVISWGFCIGQCLDKYWIFMSNLCPRAFELDRISTDS